MKTAVAILLTSLFVLSSPLSSRASEMKKSSAEKFYGKITAIDAGAKTLSVHNKTKNADAVFAWNDSTEFVSNKQPIAASALKAGDFLVISFKDLNGGKQAQKVVLRTNSGSRKSN